jgi:succinyl-CoA synthetase beta subunit
LAAGVVAAAKKVGVKVPLVVRLEGTNHEEGRRILNASGLTFSVAQTMAEAAKKIAQVVKKAA